VQTAAGQLQVDVDGVKVAGDLLPVTGKATLGGTIFVNPLEFAKAAPGDNQVTVLTAAQGIANSGFALTTTPSSLISFRLVSVGANTLAVGFGVDFAPDSFGLSGNRYAIGQAFDAVQAAGASAAFAAIAPSLFAVPTGAALASLYDGLSGEGVSGAEQTSFAADDQFIAVVARQFDAWRRGVPGAGNEVSAGDTRLWFSGRGQRGVDQRRFRRGNYPERQPGRQFHRRLRHRRAGDGLPGGSTLRLVGEGPAVTPGAATVWSRRRRRACRRGHGKSRCSAPKG
jgi:uncharacterized protein with beta-barrel porin domain